MKKFEQQLKEFKDSSFAELSGNPSDIFNTLFVELEKMYDITTDFSQLDEVKRHLSARIQQTDLPDDQQQYYLTEITDLDDYTRLFIFLEQQIQGM